MREIPTLASACVAAACSPSRPPRSGPPLPAGPRRPPACGVSTGEPARHRRAPAAPELAARVRRARRRADRLPGPGGRDAALTPSAVGHGQGRVRPLDPRALRRPGARVVERATSGGCGSGTTRAAPPPGARPPSGRWGCSTPGDWQAQWIGPRGDEDVEDVAARAAAARPFTVKGAVRSARVYVTASASTSCSSTASAWATSSSRPAGRATTSACSTRPTT